MANIILVIAGLFFLGHFLNWIFQKTKVPDLLILIIIGFLAGPSVFNMVTQKDIGQVGTVLATMTLIIILYEGGLHLNAKSLWQSSLSALFLSLLSFVLIAAVTTFILSFAFSVPTALLVGLGIGSTSSAVVFPLLKPLALQEKTKTLLSLESAFTDVLTIITFLAVLESTLSNNYNTSSLLFGIGAKPFISVGLGIGFALSWSFLRKVFLNFLDMPFATEAWSLLTYGCIEFLGLNGPIAVLSFGFVLSNLNLLPSYLSFALNLKPVTEDEMSLLKAISFLLKTFFFLYLGMIMQLSSMSTFLWALLLVFLILVTRYFAVRIVFSTKQYAFFDALIAFSMGPRGLACAVLATLPLQKGYAEGLFIQNVIFYTIFISIVVTSIFVIFGKTRGMKYAFSGLFHPYPDKIDNPESLTSSTDTDR